VGDVPLNDARSPIAPFESTISPFLEFVMHRILGILCLFALVLTPTYSMAAIQTKTIEYRDGDVVLEGFLAWDDSIAKAPGVLIVHQWLGLTEYEQGRAKQLAGLGYVAFALDIYGKGNKPAGVADAGKVAGGFKNDRKLYRKRLQLGLAQLRAQTMVQTDEIAAIGYCFGGTGVLELARSGADIDGVVSFHGGLDSPAPADAKNIKAKILICHGADDPFVPAKDIDAMKKEFTDADVDWQMIYYSEAVHSFTQPMAGNDNSRGAAYQEKADKRSWKAMNQFFEELFANQKSH
jgi:dienelactone hydrolase